MSLEIEKNFYKYDEKFVKTKLKKMNASYTINLLKTFKIKHNKLMVRVRDEGYRKTFTIKNKNNNNNYNKEYEVTVSDIKLTLKMLKLLGFKNVIYQEKIRETYFYKNSEICFDFVPGQENFLQIESKTESELNGLIEILKLNNNDQHINPYENYGLIKEEIKDKIKFNSIQEIENLVLKNHEEFKIMIKRQNNLYKSLMKLDKI